MNASTDRIEKQIVLKAPRNRVWQALTTAEQFGNWFGVELQGKTFAVGKRVKGPNISCDGTSKGTFWDALIERIDPEQFFAYRWHPYSADPTVDLSDEPMTLVEFELKDTADGTLLHVVESGFDRIDVKRRAESYPMHTNGWEYQLKNIESYLAKL